MTYDEGKQLALDGVEFGSIYPHLGSDQDRERFKGWWLMETSVPVKGGGAKVRPIGPSPSINGHSSEKKGKVPIGGAPPKMSPTQAKSLGYTGGQCPTCFSVRMVWNGSCQKCEDCGATTGCS